MADSVQGWRDYKYYLIGQWKVTKDPYYKKSARKVDKIIKNLLKNKEQDLDMDYEL